jgi:UDP-galactopyranose mutase
MKREVGVVGAGFAGAVLARELAESGNFKVVVFDERNHVAGNCHTERDKETGVLVHKYGPHIFHTSREDVWKYINRFGQFGVFTNRVKAVTAQGMFTLPINLLTINQFFKKQLRPQEAKEFVATLGDATIGDAKTFEEQALKFLGRDLYETFFRGYTKKQWGVEPSELPATILQRLPVRFNYDDNYYASKYQGIPVEGYTKIVENILDHPNIQVRLGERFSPELKSEFAHLFFSGPMDSFFGYQLGRLQYRSLVFERFDEEGDYQGNPVINYCEEKVPYTRITEHKHFAPWEVHQKTVCFREYSKLADENDIPYYPLRLKNDKSLLKEYTNLVHESKGVTFLGRLATYRYLDMHAVIGESLDLANTCITNKITDWPKFSTQPI